MTPFEARLMLQIPDGPVTQDVVMTAYRAAVKASHPDTATEAPRYSMAQLQQAKELLCDVVAERNNPCPQCRGRGMVPGRFGMQRCAACDGSGDKSP